MHNHPAKHPFTRLSRNYTLLSSAPSSKLVCPVGETLAMPEYEAYRHFLEWITSQRRGRQRIRKASKDPVARARLLADIPPPHPVTLRPPNDDIRSALISLPAYCTPATTPVSCSSPITPHYFSFLGSFPAEIRNAIYHYAIDYPTCRELFDAYYNQADSCRTHNHNHNHKSNAFAINFYTPTILLLCKQITWEALTVFRLRPFVIDRIPPWIMGNPAPLLLTDLISKGTLQNLRFAEIRLSLGDSVEIESGTVWLWVLENVLKAWSEKNSLIRLKVMIKVHNINRSRIWDYELPNYEEIIKTVNYFAFKYGTKPDMVEYEHWVLDYNYAYKCGYRNPLIRMHPDPNIWQGSVLEWI
ncbi:hypothetical protein F5Y19DRAFT_300307 [Xylariaceae sp. FL1651]|nr:hypothetical protein F5Y19DRAFT_300307 [Xylariaceae sp. FL1651]